MASAFDCRFVAEELPFWIERRGCSIDSHPRVQSMNVFTSAIVVGGSLLSPMARTCWTILCRRTQNLSTMPRTYRSYRKGTNPFCIVQDESSYLAMENQLLLTRRTCRALRTDAANSHPSFSLFEALCSCFSLVLHLSKGIPMVAISAVASITTTVMLM